MVIQAQYFPDGDFLTAHLGANPCYMWYSILVTQYLVKRGCGRRIGDDNRKKHGVFPLELKYNKVSGLNNVSQNRWDNDIINDLGNERDGQLIKQIPIQRRNRADQCFWNYVQNAQIQYFINMAIGQKSIAAYFLLL